MNYIQSPLPTHFFLLEDANKYGSDAAIILYHLRTNIERNQNLEEFFKQETYWCSTSIDALLSTFPYFQNRFKIQRLIKKLIDECAIVDGNFNKNRSDQTKWYALQTAVSLNEQNSTLECADLNNETIKNTPEQNTKNTLETSENLNEHNCTLECADLNNAMCKSTHSHNITYLETIDRVESAQERDNNNGFGLKEFVERFNQIPNDTNKVDIADEAKVYRWPNKIKAILDKSTRAEVEAVFAKIENNHYLLGQAASNKGIFWSLNIGWLTLPDNWQKVANDSFAKHDKQKDKPQAKAAPALDYTRLWEQYKTFKNAPPVIEAVNKFIKDSRLAQMIIDDGGHDKLCHYLASYLRQLVKDGAPIDIHQIEHKLLAPFNEYRAPKAKKAGQS